VQRVHISRPLQAALGVVALVAVCAALALAYRPTTEIAAPAATPSVGSRPVGLDAFSYLDATALVPVDAPRDASTASIDEVVDAQTFVSCKFRDRRPRRVLLRDQLVDCPPNPATTEEDFLNGRTLYCLTGIEAILVLAVAPLPDAGAKPHGRPKVPDPAAPFKGQRAVLEVDTPPPCPSGSFEILEPVRVRAYSVRISK
jgi:hypothetical protein